jgi:hypothetical protein
LIDKQKILVQHSSFEEITILNNQGNEISKTAKNYTFLPSELRDRGFDPFIQKALAGNNFTHILPGNSRPTFTFIVPINDSSDHLTGWLEAKMNLNYFWELIAKNHLAKNHHVFVIDLKNQYLLLRISLSRYPKIFPTANNRALAEGNTGVWEYWH